MIFTGRNTADVREWVNELSPDGVSWFVTKSMTAPTGMQAWRFVRAGQEWPEGTDAAVYDHVMDSWVPLARGDTIVRTGVTRYDVLRAVS